MKMIAVATALTMCVAVAAAEHAESTDPQIAGILVAANQVEIDAGKVAVEKSHRNEVREFARHMITDYSQVNETTADLTSRLHLIPEDSHISQGLKFGGEENLAALQVLDGAAFDSAYLEQEVAYHEHVLEAINEWLIPNTSNAELRALLTLVEPALEADLEHAKSIQTTLAKKD
jgi:putative membrane protein